MSEDYYALLGLPRDASLEEVEDALRQQLNVWSRRVNNAPRAADRREAEEKVELLEQAKAVLRDKSGRLEYECALPGEEPHGASVAGERFGHAAEDEINIQRVARWNQEFVTWVHRFDHLWRATEPARVGSDCVSSAPGTSNRLTRLGVPVPGRTPSASRAEDRELGELVTQGVQLDEVISRWPHVHTAHRSVLVRVGDAFMAQGASERAKIYYRKGADVDPQHEQGQTPRAACLFRLASMTPEGSAARGSMLTRGIETLALWAGSSSPELALGDAGETIPEPGSPKSRLRQADEVAFACARAGLDGTESRMVLSLQRGVLLCRLGAHDDARRCYIEAHELASATDDESSTLLSYARVGEVALAMGDYGRGHEIIRSVLAAMSRSYHGPQGAHRPYLRDFVMCLFAVAEWHLGRYENAIWTLGAIRPWLPFAQDYQNGQVVAALLGVEPPTRHLEGPMSVDPTNLAEQVGADRDRLRSAWAEGRSADPDSVYGHLLERGSGRPQRSGSGLRSWLSGGNRGGQ
ncbi:MAG TPA: tetratricopeptide repeat protein [Solirubrobacteraceae bacterium]|nr:tetratricopeptide repeat protein [Solirubrobacteraceae bacterium]